VSEANGALSSSLFSRVESEVGEVSNDQFDQFSSLGLEAFHVTLVFISVLLDVGHDSGEVGFDETKEGLLVGELHFLEFQGSGDVTSSSRVFGYVDRQHVVLVGLGLSVAIVTHDVSGESADPFVFRSVNLFFSLLDLLFLLLRFLFLFLFRETLLIRLFGMLGYGMLVGLNHSFCQLEFRFADDALSNCFSLFHLQELSFVSDDACVGVFLVRGFD
jgi:hypothetical protein